MSLPIEDLLILIFLGLLLLIVIIRASLLIGLEQSLERRTTNDSTWDKTHTFIASIIVPWKIEHGKYDSTEGVIKALNVLCLIYWSTIGISILGVLILAIA